MKYLIVLLLLFTSCASYNPKMYVGNYTGSNSITKNQYSDRNTIQINTTDNNIHGSIYMYGKKCSFTPGQLLYIECNQQYMGALQFYSVYHISNGNKSYRLRQWRMNDKLFTQYR